MCGLSGIIAYTDEGKSKLPGISASLQSIIHRGPDYQNIYRKDHYAVGHARLSILDPSPSAHQPFFSDDKRDFIVHNGEIFNFHALRKKLQSEGIECKTSSDTEVILKLFLKEGISCSKSLDGFFATVISDADHQCWYLIRDPMGKKPLYYYSDDHIFAFSSELQGLLAFRLGREPDWDSIFTYLQLNYIPQPWTALQGVKQVRPGHYLKVSLNNPHCEEHSYYGFQEEPSVSTVSSKGKELDDFGELFTEAVRKRLISDVPLGAFLSGGLDSSAVVSVASSMVPNLSTFSIGFSDDPYYDESRYAEVVARCCRTHHHTIQMKSSEMLEVIPDVLEHLGEPFGDSSAIALFLLSKAVGKSLKVALSGDGSDELLGGYNKHVAESLLRKNRTLIRAFSPLLPLLSTLPQSRNSSFGNKTRQLVRLLQGVKLDPAERYWRWCSISSEDEVSKTIKFSERLSSYPERKDAILKNIRETGGDFNTMLSTDLGLVLTGDMLVKTDRMSMAHGLEIRSPFLDPSLVRYCQGLPGDWKTKGRATKIILRKFLGGKIPETIINRSKQGFEVPLQRWLKGELQEKYISGLLGKDYLVHQSIFEPEEIKGLLKRLSSGNPGDSANKVWGILVFQYWWKKHIGA